MRKDLKNVILTFGLIIFVSTWGSLVYSKNIENNQLLTVQQGKLKNDQIIADQIKKQALLKKQITQTQSALNNIQNQNTPTPTSIAQADALKQQALLLAEQQAQILAQQKAANAIAQQKAQALAQAQTQNTMPVSRNSRAS